MRRSVRIPAGRTAFILGLAVVLAFACALVLRQPLTSSWARYADADSAYVGSGISILDGERTRYFDHPGIPLQALAAVSFAVQFVAHVIGGGARSLHAYSVATMLHLDSTRVWFRGWAVLFYLFGASLSYVLARRLLRSTALGVAAGLAWIAAPGIGAMSIQFRPDVLLTTLVVVLAYLIATTRLTWAALLLGFAVTVKVHAAGMVVPLAIVTVLRPPPDGWGVDLYRGVRGFVVRRRLWVAVAAAVWVGLIVLLNARAWPFGPAPSQRTLVAEIVVALVAYWIAALSAERLGAAPWVLRAVGPYPALLLTLVAVGIALSLLLVVSDAGIALQTMKNTLTGGGLNAHVGLAHGIRSVLTVWRVLGGAAFTVLTCVLAYRRRCLWPVAVLAGALVMTAMAAGRLGGYAHYYAPPYMLAVLVALWLVRELPFASLGVAAAAAAGAAALVAIVQIPKLPVATACNPSLAKARTLLHSGEVALAPRAVTIPDIEYHVITESTVNLVPPYPFEFVTSTPDGLATAKQRDLQPRYAVDPSFATGPRDGVRAIGTAGRFRTKIVFRTSSCGVGAITGV